MNTLQKNKIHFLVCSPDYFEITQPFLPLGPVNNFAVEGYKIYSNNPARFLARARKQWDTLMDCFINVGIELVSLLPQKDMPYLVFTADASLSVCKSSNSMENTADNAITFISKFSNNHRSHEAGIHYEFIESKFPRRRFFKSPYHCEGAGDNLYDAYRNLFWSGYTQTPGRKEASSGRSDRRFHNMLGHKTHSQVISIEVKKPFFHIDTTLAPLPRGHMVVYEYGMTDPSFRILLEEGFRKFGLDEADFLIKVDECDAKNYACNLVSHGNTIIMPRCSEELVARISSKGYDVTCCDVSSFIHAGGAIHCMVNQLT